MYILVHSPGKNDLNLFPHAINEAFSVCFNSQCSLFAHTQCFFTSFSSFIHSFILECHHACPTCKGDCVNRPEKVTSFKELVLGTMVYRRFLKFPCIIFYSLLDFTLFRVLHTWGYLHPLWILEKYLVSNNYRNCSHSLLSILGTQP